MVRIFSIQGFRLFDSSINILLTFEFGHYISTLRMAIFDKVDYIEIEPALIAYYDRQTLTGRFEWGRFSAAR